MFQLCVILQCLVEAVTVLDLICEVDEGHVPRVHQEVKRLYARVSSEAQYAPIVLQILQFFVNHSKFSFLCVEQCR